MSDYENVRTSEKYASKAKQLKNPNSNVSKSNCTNAIIQRAQVRPESLTCSEVMVLQRAIGNRAVAQFMRINQNHQNGMIQKKDEKVIDGKATQLQVEEGASSPIQRMLVGIEMETTVPIYENGMRADHVDGFAGQASEYDHENVDETLRQPLGSGFEVHVDNGDRVKSQALKKISSEAKMHIMEIVSKPVASREALLLKLQIARNFLSLIETYSEVTGDAYSIGWPIPRAHYTLSNGDETVSVEDLELLFNQDYQNSKAGLYDVAAQLTFQLPPDHLKRISDGDTKKYKTGGTEEVEVFNRRYDNGKKEWVSYGSKVERPIEQDHPIVDRESMATAMFLQDALENKYIRRLVDVTVKIFKDTLIFLQKGVSGTVKNAVSYLVRSDLKTLFPSFSPEIASRLKQAVVTILKLTTIKELNIPQPLLDTIYLESHDALMLNSKTYKSITNPREAERGELEHVNEDLQESLKTKAIKDEEYGDLWPWTDAMEWLGNEVGKVFLHDGDEVTGPLHGSRNLSLLPSIDQEAELHELQNVEDVSRDWLTNPHEKPYPDEVIEARKYDKDPAQEGVVVEDRFGIAFDIKDGEFPGPITRKLDDIGF